MQLKKGIIFDQYSRYKVCADALKNISAKTGTILDVGSGEECILENFLSGFDISYVDPLLALHPERPKNKIAGNIFTHELDDKLFDYVLCIDTLEHVVSNDRGLFIERVCKLARKAIIFANPCSDVGDATETDKWINNMYKTAFGHDYKWLEEHFANGLPSLSETLNKLHSLGYKTQVIQNGHTPWLKELLTFVVCALEFSSGRSVVTEISDYFNEHLYPFDHMEPCYRQVIIAAKEDVPSLVQTKISDKERQEADKYWEFIRSKLVSHFSNITVAELKNLGELKQKFDNAVNDVDVLQKLNLEHRDLLKESSSHTSKLESQLSNLQSFVKDQESHTSNLESQLSNLQSFVKDKESQITNLQTELANAQRMILDIHQSFVLRMLHKYDKTIGKVIPLRPKKYAKSSKKESSQEEQLINTQKAVEHIKLEKKDILCFPIINWDFRFQRTQHLMTKFAEQGHRIFYFTVNLRNLNKPYEIKSLANNIYQIELNSPKFFDIYKDKFDNSLLESLLDSFKTFHKDLKIDAFSFIVFPTWAPLAFKLKKIFGYKIVFDCLDDFHGFSNVTKERIKEENVLLKESDLVLTTASLLFKKALEVTPKAIFLPNAGEFNHFNKSNSEHMLENYKKPIIGYFGAIADWFDNELIEFIATKRPNFTFVFIGHTFGSDIRKLQELKNVHFLGERPYSELPKYLQDFNVCLIPFKNSPLIKATHPVKIYEYFSAGKPVVTTEMTELLTMSDLCYLSKNKEDFLENLDLALRENDSSLKEKRMKFASKNTWQHRFDYLHLELNKIPSLNLENHS